MWEYRILPNTFIPIHQGFISTWLLEVEGYYLTSRAPEERGIIVCRVGVGARRVHPHQVLLSP